MDHFMEEVVVNHHKTANEIAFVLANILMVVNAVVGMVLLQGLLYGFSIFGLILTVLFAGSAVLLFLFKDKLRTEYEYTFTNGDLDFAQVYNNKKRKSLGTMRVKNVEAFGPVSGNTFRKMINMPGIQRRNWFLNREANLYFFYYQKESKKNMIIFEPSEELVGMIKQYLPRGAFQE